MCAYIYIHLNVIHFKHILNKIMFLIYKQNKPKVCSLNYLHPWRVNEDEILEAIIAAVKMPPLKRSQLQRAWVADNFQAHTFRCLLVFTPR